MSGGRWDPAAPRTYSDGVSGGAAGAVASPREGGTGEGASEGGGAVGGAVAAPRSHHFRGATAKETAAAALDREMRAQQAVRAPRTPWQARWAAANPDLWRCVTGPEHDAPCGPGCVMDVGEEASATNEAHPDDVARVKALLNLTRGLCDAALAPPAVDPIAAAVAGAVAAAVPGARADGATVTFPTAGPSTPLDLADIRATAQAFHGRGWHPAAARLEACADEIERLRREVVARGGEGG